MIINNFFFHIIYTLLINEIKAQWNTKDFMKREHSLIKPYQGKVKFKRVIFITKQMYIAASGMTIPFWDFTGSTMVTNNHVRITPDLQSSTGTLWNSVVRIREFFFFFVIMLQLVVFSACKYKELGFASAF